MHQQTAASTANSGDVSPRDLFALTDEQILEIEPELAESVQADKSAPAGKTNVLSPTTNRAELESRTIENAARVTGQESPPTSTAEPPPWLAQLMNDQQGGSEARDLWNGVQQTRNEAAAYREVFAKPEQARAAAERAHALEEIDAAFFGGAGKSAQEISEGRVALTQRMLREDPAAFREMVFAGLRALDEEGAPRNARVPIRLGSADSATAARTANGTGPAAAVTSSEIATSRAPVGARHAVPSADTADAAQLGAYRAFEKSANEELEQSVGGAIERTLAQALPATSATRGASGNAASLQTRLQQAVRADVELALKGDTQLGEQISQVLATRRFDEATRSQIVRLINDRAQQLVPVAARRVIQEWTHTAFAAYSGKGSDRGASSSMENGAAEANAAKPRSLAGSPSVPRQAGAQNSRSGAGSRAAADAPSASAAAADRAERDAGLTPRQGARPNGRALDYRRLSDEQILEL